MRTSKEIKKLLSNEVENLLRNNSYLRNCDRKLSVVIWRQQLKNLDVSESNFFELK